MKPYCLAILGAALCAAASAPVLDLSRTPHRKIDNVPIGAVRMGAGFWQQRRDVNVRVSIPTLLEEFEQRGILDNFRRLSGRKKVERRGPLYTDSDVYKWMEAVAFTLASGDDPKLRAALDRVIDDVIAAQEPSGYINTYYSAERAAERHTNLRHGHELYCGGHLIQAGIAHFRATGDRRLLEAGIRFADHLLAHFGRDKKPIIEGHPEMEMAMVELYRTTRNRKYLDFAGYLLEGEPERIQLAPRDLVYLFTGKPYVSRTQFEGHSVRALYASSGAADYALETGDAALRKTMEHLWRDVTGAKMYITGGVGSRAQGEAFGEPFELPNQLAYTESCAAIANMMWNWRLLAGTGEARFAEIVERALYNGVNSGLSLSGNLYCYRNPLELTGNPQDKIRNPWYDTTCCPPNLQRVLASLPGYLYGVAEDGLYVHLYHSNDLQWKLRDGSPLELKQETRYPWDGDVLLTFGAGTGRPAALYLRIPSWSRQTTVWVNGKPAAAAPAPGAYLRLERDWKRGDTVRLRFDVRPRLTAANPRVRDDIGKVAVERGPLVYAMEGLDQSVPMWETSLALRPDGEAEFSERYREDLLGGVVEITAKARVREPATALYESFRKRSTKPAAVRLIPYYAFANREPSPMQVWIPFTQ